MVGGDPFTVDEVGEFIHFGFCFQLGASRISAAAMVRGSVGRHRFSGRLSCGDQLTITGGVVSLALSQTSWSLSDTKRSYAPGQCMVGLSGSVAGCATGVAGLSKAAGSLSASISRCEMPHRPTTSGSTQALASISCPQVTSRLS